MSFNNFGYDDKGNECFDNIILIYNDGELTWITCKDNEIENSVDYFDDDDYFIISYSLLKRDKYNMTFATNITYDNIIEDIKTNNIKVRLGFDKIFYEKNRKITIEATSFDDAKKKLKYKLQSLIVF